MIRVSFLGLWGYVLAWATDCEVFQDTTQKLLSADKVQAFSQSLTDYLETAMNAFQITVSPSPLTFPFLFTCFSVPVHSQHMLRDFTIIVRIHLH